MLVITQHAHQRFLERFPDVPVCLTERVEAAIPFGGQKGASEMRLDMDYNVVFVLNRDDANGDLILATILTRDQALANFAVTSNMRAWRNCAIEPRAPVAALDATLAKIDDSQTIRELQALAKSDVETLGFLYPERQAVKEITKKIRNERGCSLAMVNKHYWPEVGRLIYEYNAKYRDVVKDAQ